MQYIIDHWGVIATALLAVSEALALIPGLKSNGIVQAIINILKNVGPEKKSA